MIKASYPHPSSFSIKKENDKDFIFDAVRKQWVKLTPEEWVRQNFISFLITNNYPSALMAIEKEIQLNDVKKRCDIVVYKNNLPWMIIECKEMGVVLTEKTVHQILNYNQTLNAAFLIITNGSETFCFDTITNSSLNELPEY